MCDVLTTERQLLHVKKYAGSQPLSHLFNQGLVSSQLLLREQSFRKGAKAKIKQAMGDDKDKLSQFTSLFNTTNFRPRDWTVTFGILGRNKPTLPFFSKVALKHVAEELRDRRYTVQVDFIPKG